MNRSPASPRPASSPRPQPPAARPSQAARPAIDSSSIRPQTRFDARPRPTTAGPTVTSSGASIHSAAARVRPAPPRPRIALIPTPQKLQFDRPNLPPATIRHRLATRHVDNFMSKCPSAAATNILLETRPETIIKPLLSTRYIIASAESGCPRNRLKSPPKGPKQPENDNHFRIPELMSPQVETAFFCL